MVSTCATVQPLLRELEDARTPRAEEGLDGARTGLDIRADVHQGVERGTDSIFVGVHRVKLNARDILHPALLVSRRPVEEDTDGFGGHQVPHLHLSEAEGVRVVRIDETGPHGGGHGFCIIAPAG